MDGKTQCVQVREKPQKKEAVVQKRAKITGWGKVNHLLVPVLDDVIEKPEEEIPEVSGHNSNGGSYQRP